MRLSVHRCGDRTVGIADSFGSCSRSASADREHRRNGEHAPGTGQHCGSLKTRPDEASITVGTQAKASTATQAVATNKVKTEKLLATIRAAGIRDRDIQTQGIQLQPDYRWSNEPNGRGQQTLIGYIASN